MKEYKLVSFQTHPTDQIVLTEEIADGWDIHTVYPSAVGLVLMQREKNMTTVTVVGMLGNGYGTRIPKEIQL